MNQSANPISGIGPGIRITLNGFKKDILLTGDSVGVTVMALYEKDKTRIANSVSEHRVVCESNFRSSN